jgi:hypothetical protein
MDQKILSLNDHDRRALDAFLGSVGRTLAGYKHASFSYFAIKEGNSYILTKGRLHLQGVPGPVAPGYFESRNVRAGNFSLVDVKQAPNEILEGLLAGKLQTPQGELIFRTNENQPFSIYYDPFYIDGIQLQRRQMRLVVTGGKRPQPNSPNIDWELKAATTPYESVVDLCNEYAVGTVSGQQITVEADAYSLAIIDPKSIVKGSTALLAMILADGLDPDQASVGIRLFDKNRVAKREQIPGAKLAWSKVEGVQRGTIEIDVPSGAVLQCIANYAGEAHQFFWVADPTTAQNPRRAVHLAFDEKLESLQELLKIEGKGREAREFESAVAWIVWMLGFNVTHIGGTRKTAEAPDLVAATPKGHFIVIECTTGILNADKKLANLVDRAEKVRQSLISSGNGHLKVLPVIVTNKTRGEIKAELDQAQKAGVLVATRDDFAEIINRTNVATDPDLLYDEAVEKVRTALQPNPIQ